MPARPAATQARPRYRLNKLLGVGATAEVWQATDTATGRSAHVKRLQAEVANDETARSRLAAELAAARLVRHEGLVPLIEADLDAAQPLIVFAPLAGETLSSVLARHGRLEPWQAARIAAQIGAALAAVHEAGLVHRDVKPGNILLGDDGQARLLDFGISTAAGAAADSHSGAGPGTTVGTLPYVAPEQLAGEPAQPASDVFALGAVLYQALSGRTPFEASGAAELALAQRVPPARIADAPEALGQLAFAALEGDPRERPSAASMAARLNAWLSGELSSEATTSVMPAVSRARSRRRTGAALGAGLLTGLALAFALALALAPGGGPEAAERRLPLEGMPGRAQADLADSAVELRLADEPAPTEDEPVALLSGVEPESQATTADKKPKPKLRGNDEKPKAKAGKGKGKEKGKGKGKGKGKRRD